MLQLASRGVARPADAAVAVTSSRSCDATCSIPLEPSAQGRPAGGILPVVPVPSLLTTVPEWPAIPAGDVPLRLGVVDGEGIGPEVVGAALTVLEGVCAALGLDIEVVRAGAVGRVGPHGLQRRRSRRRVLRRRPRRGHAGAHRPGGRAIRLRVACALRPVRQARSGASAARARRCVDRAPRADHRRRRADRARQRRRPVPGRLRPSRERPRRLSRRPRYDADQVDRLIAVAVRAAAAAARTARRGDQAGRHPDHQRAVARAGRGGCRTTASTSRSSRSTTPASSSSPTRIASTSSPRPNMLGDVVADTAALVLGLARHVLLRELRRRTAGRSTRPATARRTTSRASTSPTRWRRSSRWRGCCARASACRTPPRAIERCRRRRARRRTAHPRHRRARLDRGRHGGPGRGHRRAGQPPARRASTAP